MLHNFFNVNYIEIIGNILMYLFAIEKAKPFQLWTLSKILCEDLYMYVAYIGIHIIEIWDVACGP